MVLLLWALRTWKSLERVRAYLASYEPIEFSFNFFDLTALQLALYVMGPAFLILPPTILMGASFSFLQRGVQSDMTALGRRVGGLQTANILGSTTGVLLVGLVLIERLGTSGTLQLLTACAAVYLVLASVDASAGLARPLKWTGIVMGIAVTFGPPAPFRRRRALGTVTLRAPARIILARMGPVSPCSRAGWCRSSIAPRCTSTVLAKHHSLQWRAFVSRPRAGAPASGAVNVAIIGLGSGDTAYSAAGEGETEHVYCVESSRDNSGRFANCTNDRGSRSRRAIDGSAHAFVVGDGGIRDEERHAVRRDRG